MRLRMAPSHAGAPRNGWCWHAVRPLRHGHQLARRSCPVSICWLEKHPCPAAIRYKTSPLRRTIIIMMTIFHFFLFFRGQGTERPCRGRATSYCGVLDEKYPDRRAMGFPFDRPIDSDDTKIYNLSDLDRQFENMATADIRIQFEDATIDKVTVKHQ